MQMGMNAGARLGRLGGVAVALGIGAAVATGHGVAWGETPSSGDGGSKSSTGTTSTGSTGTTSNPETSKPESLKPTPETSLPSTDSDVKTPESTPKTKTNKRSTAPPPTKRSAPPAAASTQSPPAAHKPSVRSETAALKADADESGVVADKTPTAGFTLSSLAVTTDPVVKPTAAPEPAEVKPTAPKPGDAVTAAISTAVSALFSPFAGGAPATPVDSPAALTVLAAVRRESLVSAPSLDTVATQTATSLVTANVAPPIPTSVVAIPQTPPLQVLQQVPILGPLLVTPIVAVLHQVPLIGTILHPYIGYPIPVGVAPGTPMPRDVKVISFDGTPIYVHFMPAYGLQPGQKAPTIFDGPGLGLPGSTNLDGEEDEFLANDIIGIAPLRRAGYNVVTWDPRGEWNSGGTLEIDSPDFEARDVSAIITWVATQPEARLDGVNDPRMGMVGASYGGGIQLVTAAIDHRVDAIVPTIAWNNLNTALYKSQAVKTSWGALLVGALVGTGARIDSRLLPMALNGALTGQLTPADQAFLDDRGPGGPRDLLKDITAPTLLIQGTVDTLFTLEEADENAKALMAQGVPVKVMWICGGHGACLTSTNDGVLVEQRTLQWLDRYVKGVSVSTGPQFEWVDQHGTNFSSNVYPVPPGAPIVASTGAGGVLPLIPLVGGSGPQLAVLGLGPIRALLGLPSAAKATNALNLTVPAATSTTYIVGAPTLTMTYSGTGTSRHVYAQLVDDSTGLVLGNLVTPVPVTLDGQTHTVSIPMEQVAHTLSPGQTVTLQVVASAFVYESIQTSGVLNVSSMQLTLPTADAAAISSSSALQLVNVA